MTTFECKTYDIYYVSLQWMPTVLNLSRFLIILTIFSINYCVKYINKLCIKLINIVINV